MRVHSIQTLLATAAQRSISLLVIWQVLRLEGGGDGLLKELGQDGTIVLLAEPSVEPGHFLVQFICVQVDRGEATIGRLAVATTFNGTIPLL